MVEEQAGLEQVGIFPTKLVILALQGSVPAPPSRITTGGCRQASGQCWRLWTLPCACTQPQPYLLVGGSHLALHPSESLSGTQGAQKSLGFG